MQNITIRLDDTVYSELKDLAAVYHSSMNQVVVNCIRAEYSHVGEDPKIKETMDKLTKLKEALELLQSK